MGEENAIVLPFRGRQSDLKPQIPAGEYTVAFDAYETAVHFGSSPKLGLHFHVIDVGEYFETPLSRWYSVERIIGKPSKNGRFKPKGQTSAFFIEYVTCFQQYGVPNRLDRIPMDRWLKHAFRVRVSNVTKNSRQRSLPEVIQYSKIESILGIAE